MRSYKRTTTGRTSISRNTAREGETIERKMERIIANKEAISDGIKPIYTERKHGVLPEHDIRTDRFEVAVEAMDKVHRSSQARREENLKVEDEKSKIDLKKRTDGGEASSAQGTE